MTHGAIAPQEVGRSCPYCHFPLKDGVPALRCDQCQSVHHEDCWRDGGGCAVYGCPNAGKGAPPPEPSTYVQPPPERKGFPWKVLILTLVALLVVIAALIAGYLLTHKDKDKPTGAKATATATAAPASSAKPTKPAANQAALAVSIEKIVAFSQAGRTAVQGKHYDAAIANRKAVLKRLQGVHGATGKLATAKATLTKAMTASLHADEAYAAGKDPSQFNQQATQLKAQFVTQWQAVASEHKLKAYKPGDI